MKENRGIPTHRRLDIDIMWMDNTKDWARRSVEDLLDSGHDPMTMMMLRRRLLLLMMMIAIMMITHRSCH